MQSYKRSTRVAELIQREISKGIQSLKNPLKGLVTVTGVKLTDDLLDARVFYSIIGSVEYVEFTKSAMPKCVPEIRRHLAAAINMRRTPRLVFVFDETPSKAEKIFEILEKINSEENTSQESGQHRADATEPDK